LLGNGLLIFPWAKRWLTGPEYEFAIKNFEAYSLYYDVTKLKKGLPEDIYFKPKDGQFFFV